MHPDFRMELIHDHQQSLGQALERAKLLEEQPAQPIEDVVALRLRTVHDDEALNRLALLEGQPPPRGRYVLAEVGGQVVAALSLDSGKTLSDPFRRTAHLLPLLRLRASQLEAQPRRRIEAAKAIAARMLHPAR